MSEVRVLVVDDNTDLADGLGMILEDEGYRVTLAYNGTDGIKAFESASFDVAFVDVKLPDMSGIEVFRTIHSKTPDARVCMMTGYRVEQLLKEVIDDGGVEILRKPIELSHVQDVLAQARKESIVLVADNDPDIADRLTTHLTGHGLETMLSRNEKRAVDDVMSRQSVEVLMLDLRMPIVCALKVYLELKRRGRVVKMIIIAATPGNEPDNVDVLQSTAATGCLFKPFRPEDLLSLLERFDNHQNSSGRAG